MFISKFNMAVPEYPGGKGGGHNFIVRVVTIQVVVAIANVILLVGGGIWYLILEQPLLVQISIEAPKN